MRTINVVMSNTKMQLALVALNNLKPFAGKNAQSLIQKTINKISDQAVKQFGEFKIDFSDSAYISMAVFRLYKTHREQILKGNATQAGWKIHKTITDLSDQFTGLYMNLDDDVKSGTDFRKVFLLPRA